MTGPLETTRVTGSPRYRVPPEGSWLITRPLGTESLFSCVRGVDPEAEVGEGPGGLGGVLAGVVGHVDRLAAPADDEGHLGAGLLRRARLRASTEMTCPSGTFSSYFSATLPRARLASSSRAVASATVDPTTSGTS